MFDEPLRDGGVLETTGHTSAAAVNLKEDETGLNRFFWKLSSFMRSYGLDFNLYNFFLFHLESLG